ncbi:uncharacterized protein BYT42DRAFT_590037 [Radiomyces spectabilis]|uniref:uncharacterized protein n=1 Tax=Radiomyces spectabilis TaxID=64574 RepID=UPI00221E7259|nr:uncharacterized protein BYT42DRAFT_590037 [Radiomyces spectabilis]KAI8364678.1 hypothetical protein BYT42DRAFT_590037 [Radiomyces spectabilis]
MAKFALILLLAFLATFTVISALWIGDGPDCSANSDLCPVGTMPTCVAFDAARASVECPSTCGDFGSVCDEGFKTCCT